MAFTCLHNTLLVESEPLGQLALWPLAWISPLVTWPAMALTCSKIFKNRASSCFCFLILLILDISRETGNCTEIERVEQGEQQGDWLPANPFNCSEAWDAQVLRPTVSASSLNPLRHRDIYISVMVRKEMDTDDFVPSITQDRTVCSYEGKVTNIRITKWPFWFSGASGNF